MLLIEIRVKFVGHMYAMPSLWPSAHWKVTPYRQIVGLTTTKASELDLEEREWLFKFKRSTFSRRFRLLGLPSQSDRTLEPTKLLAMLNPLQIPI